MASGIVPGDHVRGYPYEISGGHLALDFANTIDARRTDNPIELLRAWDNLVVWSARTGAIKPATVRRLIREGALRPEEATAVLRRARFVREATFAVFEAVAKGRTAPREPFTVLNDAMTLLGRRRLATASSGFDWEWHHPDGALDVMLPPVIAAAADLLRTPSMCERVRVCASVDRCAWLFLDTSRNGSRRWCDMTVCGNRAKAKRHYENQHPRSAVYNQR